MKTSIKVISLCTAALLGFVWAPSPVAAQTKKEVQAQAQKQPGTVGQLTFKRGLLAKPTNTKSEGQVLLEQMRTASAELKESGF